MELLVLLGIYIKTADKDTQWYIIQGPASWT